MNSIPIIYENQEILIIDKPHGVAVQGGQNIAHPLDKELPKQLGYNIYLVHRLDKDTSGLMVVAKTPAAANKWTKLISQKEVKKEYDALCIGVPSKKEGVFDYEIVDSGIEKSALTFYKVVKSYEVGEFTLSHIHLTLKTGRMHQIRIHLKKAGFPIVQDDKHGNFKINKALKKLCKIKSLQLISSKLTMTLDGKEQTFSVPVEFEKSILM